VDAGCGNGYYLDQLIGYLSINDVEAEYLGFDISKWAVRKGAIRNKNIRWIVADVKRPLLDIICVTPLIICDTITIIWYNCASLLYLAGA
jgi:hypothetical protein